MSGRQGCWHADEEQLRRERAALRSRESAFVQRSTEQDTAVTAEEARLVEQAQGLDLQRAAVENAETALQAQRTRTQQGESCTASLHYAFEALVRIFDGCSRHVLLVHRLCSTTQDTCAPWLKPCH